MINIVDKFVAKIKTPILCSVMFFFFENPATDEYMIRRMRYMCWITKATYTHSE
jgi:hypothetical protein